MTKQEAYETGKRFLSGFGRDSIVPWRNRFVFWSGAVVIGVIAAGFAYISDYAQMLFTDVVEMNRALPILISPIIFALSAWLTARFCPYARSSGIPQAIAAREVETNEQKNALLGIRNVLGKMALTALALVGGASVGREGPTVQVGAGLLYLAGIHGKIDAGLCRSLILAGAAAGVAAAFNTPLAGIVFAIEEMARAFE
ncbi:MAG: chloride channel protein, partial [Alphaproteobacteria bacterium]|nr:chloride channel protein [Alphaproteobacteria bacterium]